jgi:DNA sulfur modification protein DndE
MGYRLKTSKKTKDIFDEMSSRTHLKPFALSKLAISLSIKSDEKINPDEYTESNGIELNRQTITGQFDALYKCLIEEKEMKHLTDDEYFPLFMKAHLDRGANLLLNRYNYSGGNLEKFILSLLSEVSAI